MYAYSFFSKTELVFQIMFGKEALFFLLVSVYLGRTGKITIEEFFNWNDLECRSVCRRVDSLFVTSMLILEHLLFRPNMLFLYQIIPFKIFDFLPSFICPVN